MRTSQMLLLRQTPGSARARRAAGCSGSDSVYPTDTPGSQPAGRPANDNKSNQT